MRKQLLATILAGAIPLAALAQGGPPAQGQAQPPGAAAKGTGPGSGPGAWRGNPEKMEKRMKLARTLGLAEALDLDAPAALKLGDTLARFDDRRLAVHKQMHDAREVLRRAASGEKVPAADVDAAVQKGLDARAQLAAIDRETVAAVTQGLTPEQKARAVLFLARFQQRFAGHMMGGPGMGPGGPGMRRGGMGPGMGPGPGRRGPGGGWGMNGGDRDGMGPGACGPMMGMASPPPPGADFDDGPED